MHEQSTIPQDVQLFSPKFSGCAKSWRWVCDCSNGNYRQPDFVLTHDQEIYAINAGYLPVKYRI